LLLFESAACDSATSHHTSADAPERDAGGDAAQGQTPGDEDASEPNPDACVGACEHDPVGFGRVSADVPPVDSEPDLTLMGFVAGADQLLMAGPVDARELYESYALSLPEGTFTHLSQKLPALGSANLLAVDHLTGAQSRDGEVLHAMDTEERGRPDLFAVSLATGAARRLSQGSEAVTEAWFAADADRVLYRSREETGKPQRLYTTSLSTPAPTPVTPEGHILASSGYGTHPQLTADGHYAVYAAQSGGGGYKLFATTADGSESHELSPPLVSGGNVFTGAFNNRCSYQVLPDNERVVFSADAEQDERYELYVANLDGSQRAKLSAAPANSAGVARVACPVTPNGKQVVYLVGLSTGGSELHVVNVETKTDLRLDTDGASAAFGPVLSQDGSGVVFVNLEKKLYYASLEGDPQVLLAEDVLGGGRAHRRAHRAPERWPGVRHLARTERRLARSTAARPRRGHADLQRAARLGAQRAVDQRGRRHEPAPPERRGHGHRDAQRGRLPLHARREAGGVRGARAAPWELLREPV